MKITFLGTSHGFAEPNRFQSSTLIEVRGKSYLIDAGAPVEYQMATLGKDFNSLRGIFITHAHLDHIGCLPQIIGPLLRYRYNDKCTCFISDEVVAEAFYTWMGANTVDVERMKSIVKFEVPKVGLIYDDGNIKVTAIKTNHFKHETRFSFGYIIDDGERKVLFTGDIGYGFDDYQKVTEGKYDLVVCEMAHADLCNVWEMMSKTDTKKMLINHWHEPRIEGYEEIFGKLPFDIQLAHDGMEVIV